MPNIYDRVLITGGGGMLAKALIGALRARGHEPQAPDRNELDIAQPAGAVIEQVVSRKPSLLLNCAAFTKVDACEVEGKTARLVNAFGPAHLAAATQAIGAKLVHYSTDFVFDGAKRAPYLTTDEPKPQSAYGHSKVLGERAMARHPNALIIRTAWLYGPGGPNFVQTMLNVARAGKPLRVVDDQIGAPTFTHDLAEATLKLIDHDARGIWHVTNAGQTSWFGFAQAIFEEFGLKPDFQPTTSAEWKKLKPNSAARPAYSVLDIEPYAKLTGQPMRHWRDALRDYRNLVEPTE